MTSSHTKTFSMADETLPITVIHNIAHDLRAVFPGWNADQFTKDALLNYSTRALKERSAHIRDTLHTHLPKPYTEALNILLASLPEPDETGGLEGMGGFRWMPYLDFVATFGLQHPNISLDALETLTLHFSAEFAIRPFIQHHPSLTWPRILSWTTHPDWRLRRLSSEGTRPRLPWASRLPALIDDPSPTLPILNALFQDPNRTVQRSVANHLNDISKDHPDLAVSTATQWWSQDPSKHARWTVQHATRTLVKAGHPDVFPLLGFHGAEHTTIADLSLHNPTPSIGDTVPFTATLTSHSDEPLRLVVDMRLTRTLKNQKRATKVFKLCKLTLPPRSSAPLQGKHAFKQLSTRTYYPGTHGFALLVNGVEKAAVEFELAP